MCFAKSVKMKFIILFFLMVILLQSPCLESTGWGITEEFSIFEEEEWNGIYLDIGDLYFTASIPNYLSEDVNDELVFLLGYARGEFYHIATPFYPISDQLITLNDFKEFVKTLTDGYPNSIISNIDSNVLGAKYTAEVATDDGDFERILIANNRMIIMSTTEADENLRRHFFDSINIRK